MEELLQSGEVFIRGARLAGHDLILELDGWTVTCRECAAHSLRFGESGWLHLDDDDPRLWRYTSEWGTLQISSRAENASLVAEGLRRAHVAATNRMLPFEEFLNARTNLVDLLEGGFGFVARGPRRLLEKYLAILTGHRVQANILVSSGRTVAKPLRCLSFEGGYVIAAAFEAKRLP